MIQGTKLPSWISSLPLLECLIPVLENRVFSLVFFRVRIYCVFEFPSEPAVGKRLTAGSVQSISEGSH